jgi:hypothetical protein
MHMPETPAHYRFRAIAGLLTSFAILFGITGAFGATIAIQSGSMAGFATALLAAIIVLLLGGGALALVLWAFIAERRHSSGPSERHGKRIRRTDDTDPSHAD